MRKHSRRGEGEMVLVKFASLCDRCGARSEEYTEWPTCADHGHLCKECGGEGHLLAKADFGEGEEEVWIC